MTTGRINQVATGAARWGPLRRAEAGRVVLEAVGGDEPLRIRAALAV